MRRRIGDAQLTGLGAGEDLMDGRSTGDKRFDTLVNECAEDCYRTFFKGTRLDYEYCDAGMRNGVLVLGIEPAYKDEDVKVIAIGDIKKQCYLQTGIARGYYGVDWQSTIHYYGQYKRSSKFTRFIDKWQPQLFPEKKS